MTIYVNARAIVERKYAQDQEVLVQIRTKPGEPERLEFPGGQIEPFESVFTALQRELAEETGLSLTSVHGQDRHVSNQGKGTCVETFEPFFGYQTIEGPVDSLGFYFRCTVEGEIVESGDQAKRPRWVPIAELEARFMDDPDQFDWLTQAALDRYLRWVREQRD